MIARTGKADRYSEYKNGQRGPGVQKQSEAFFCTVYTESLLKAFSHFVSHRVHREEKPAEITERLKKTL